MNKVIATSTKYLFKSKMVHCIKSARIRSYSGPHFPAFGLNKKRCSVSLPMRKNADQSNSEYRHFLRSGHFT